MVDPRIMCNQHLLGEHVELHMLCGHLERGRSIKGYISSNAVEPLSIMERHEELAIEMGRRGMSHKSPIDRPSLDFLSSEDIRAKVNVEKSKALLIGRCIDCYMRIDTR